MKQSLELERHSSGHLMISAAWTDEDDICQRVQVISSGRDCHDRIMEQRFHTLCEMASDDVTLIAHGQAIAR